MQHDLLDRAAKAIIATRAPGLGKHAWARLAAEAVIKLTQADAPPAPRRAPSTQRGAPDRPIVHIRARQCGGWIGTFDDGSLRIGVTEATEEETRGALDAAVARWSALAEGTEAATTPS